MKVLFVTYGGGHVQMCLPVVRALREADASCEVDFMALTTAHGVARAAGVSVLGYRDFTDAPGAADALRYGAQLLASQENPMIARDETIAYLGFNFLQWVQEHGEVEAWRRWESVGRHGFRPTGFFRHVLGRLRPDVVVATNSPRSEEAAIDAASEFGIPTVVMTDLFAASGDPFIRRARHADRITVLCDSARANLVAAGVPPARIVVTGNPAFDELSGPCAVEAGLAWRRDKGWDGLHTVLWAGHLEPKDADPRWAGVALGTAVQERLVAWVQARPGAALVVRYHPNEFQAFAPPPVHPRIHWSTPDREPLLPVLSAADDVIVQITTVGVQAAVAGKRVITLGFSPFVQRSGMDFAELGLAVSAPRVEDIEALLDAGASREARTAWQKGQHGSAAAAVGRVVRELAAA